MDKKSKPPLNLPRSSTPPVPPATTADLGETVKTLIQSQRSRSQLLTSLRHRRREILKSHESRLNDFESKFALKSEDLTTTLDELKASIAEEKHRRSQLAHPSKSTPKRREQLQAEISASKESQRELVNAIRLQESANTLLEEEIKAIREERLSVTASLSSTRDDINELKKKRRSLESEREGLAYLHEKQGEKLSEYSARLAALEERRSSSFSAGNDKMKRLVEDLELRYGEQRLARERSGLALKYERSLAEALQNTADKLKEQERDLAHKLASTERSIEQLQRELALKVARREESAGEAEGLYEKMLALENELRGIEQVCIDNKYAKRDSKERVSRALGSVKGMLERYCLLSQQMERLTTEKLGVLRTVSQTKAILKEDRLLQENVSSEFNGETEGETIGETEGEGEVEDELFPELMEELLRKNLHIEAWGFGRKIVVRNMGGSRITVYEGSSIIVKKSKKEFVFGEEFVLGPGEFCLVRRKTRDEGRGAKAVFEWGERFLSEWAVDDVMLCVKGEVVSKSILVNDNYHDAICNAVVSDEIVGGEGEASEVGGDDRNRSCAIF